LLQIVERLRHWASHIQAYTIRKDLARKKEQLSNAHFYCSHPLKDVMLYLKTFYGIYGLRTRRQKWQYAR